MIKKEKPNKILYFAALLLIIGFTISVISSNGLAEPKMFEEMVPMRDGVRLHTFVYLPDSEFWSPPYPAIVARTPYGIGEAGVLPGPDRPFMTAVGKAAQDVPGPVLRGWKAIIARGYACVFQDTRGRFASEGTDRIYLDEASDGYETVEWVAKQPWCNGKVGMAGSSAAGLTSYAAASKRPPHLKAIIAQVGPVNNYNANIYEGQAFEWERALYWPLMQVPGFSPSHIKGLGLSDKDLQAAKELRDVIFNDAQKYLLTESKWWMRLPLLNYPSLSVLYPIINEMMSHPTQDDFRDNQDFGKSIEIPTLHLTTWYDMFCSGVLEAFKTIQERVGTQQKLFIGPGGHMAVYQPDFWPYDSFFPWFDYWLKGIDTGIMDEPPIYYYHIASQKWRYADLWPPPSVEYKQYYLHSDGVLSTNAPSSGEPSVSYVYDPQSPVVTIGGKGLYIPAGSFDQRPVEPPHRKDVLAYTSDILTTDIEIAGNVEVVLHASSSCKDTDFTAKLIDVHPDGKTMLILEGVIRALYRESSRDPVPMESGKIYEFSINLSEISHVFKAGHRIQVDISSSNFPRRARNTNSGNVLYTADSEKDIVVATNTIYHDSKYSSYVILPVLPPQKPSVFEGTASVKTTRVTYMGPAELYTFPTAVYLHFKDQWIKWKNTKILRRESEESYKCEGKIGKLSVLVQTKGQTSFEALATGEAVYFKGGSK